MTENILTAHVHEHKEYYHHIPKSTSDTIAYRIVRTLALGADMLFQTRYGHRAIVLETVAAVPGMVGGLLQHLKSLRFIRDDAHWIKTLLDEADNERMHLLIYSHLAKPTVGERILILIVQFFFYHFYFILYLVSAQTAHRVIGYFEEEAIHSYETYLHLVESGEQPNTEAPQIAKEYWKLKDDATLIDVIQATIQDEIVHRDVNHEFSENKRATFWK